MLQLLNVFKLPALFVFGLLLGIAIFSGPARVTSTQASAQETNQLVSLISRQSGVNISRLKFSNLKFKANKDANIYLLIFNQNFIQAHDNSIKAFAAIEGLPESQARNFIEKGDTSFLTVPSDVDDQASYLNQRSQELKESYEEEKSLFQSLAFLQNQTFALELFTNNNQKDSTFDLVSDLNTIEQKLFGINPPSVFGDMPSSGRSNAQNLSDAGYSADFRPEITPASSSPETSATENAPDSQQNTANALACPIDSGLQAELNQFEVAANEPESTDSADTSSPASGSNTQLLNSLASGLPPTFKVFPSPDQRCADAVKTFGNLFCLKIEEVRTTAGLQFLGEQYCVACVIEKISNITAELSAQSLTPSKLTGNFGEPSVCKKAVLSAFSLNIYFVPKPARSDLPLTAQLEQTSLRNTASSLSPEIEQPDTAEVLNRASDAIQESLLGVNTAIQDAQTIVAAENAGRSINSQLGPEIETLTEFSNQLNARLLTFSQNFVTLNEQIQALQDTFISVTQKPACSAL
jgi:hypothetical protein